MLYPKEIQLNPGLTICKGSSKIISLNREYRYTGVLPHTYYRNFYRVGKRLLIVIPGISLYRRLLNRGSTVRIDILKYSVAVRVQKENDSARFAYNYVQHKKIII